MNGPRAISPTLCGALLTMLLYMLGGLQPLENALMDSRARLFERTPADDIVVVEIDANSIRELSTWPWSRSTHADLLDRLAEANVKQVFLDIDFSNPSPDPVADAALAASISKQSAMRVVLASFWRRVAVADTSTYLLTRPLNEMTENADVGLVNVSPSDDGLVRDLVHVDQALAESRMSVSAVLSRQSGYSPNEKHPLDFGFNPADFRRLSYVDVLKNRTPKDWLAGSTVLVGATAVELGDYQAVPVYRSIPGVYLQAIAYANARTQVLSYAPAWLGVVSILLASFLWHFMGHRSWRQFSVVFLATTALMLAVAHFMQSATGIVVAVFPPLVALCIGGLFGLVKELDRQALTIVMERVKAMRRGALLSSMLDGSTDGILILDADGLVTSANAAALELLNSGDDANGQKFSEFLRNVDPEDLTDLARRCAESQYVEARLEGRDNLPIELSVSMIEVSGARSYMCIVRDVSKQIQQRDALRYQATHDALTGLPNRTMLSEWLADLSPVAHGALCMLDLDRFKEINDTLGHSAGDQVLIVLGRRLAEHAGNNVLIARIGGDEFAVWLPEVADEDRVAGIVDTLVESIQQPISLDNVCLEVGGAIGIAMYPQHGDDRETLLRRADGAMYSAKRSKKKFEFYDPESQASSLRQLQMAPALRRAIEADKLELHYQPKISLYDGNVVGFEALARWNDEELGFVSPAEFVTLAEETDLIHPLTRWTIRRAIRDLERWHETGVKQSIAINLSARHFSDAEFFEELITELSKSTIEPSFLEFEITESSLMQDPEKAVELTTQIHQLGIKLSVDDFGTGFSSLAYLKNLNVDTLKIDRCFITDLHQNEDDFHIVDSTIRMAHGLGLNVVAEGIEIEEQLFCLQELDCDTAQGYFFAKPMRPADLDQWMVEHVKLLPNFPTRQEARKQLP